MKGILQRAGGLFLSWLDELLFPDDVLCLCCDRALSEDAKDGVCPACARALERLNERREEWERTHGLPDGSFWSYDNYDAMEYSVSGTDKDLKVMRGVRPTLNSYMCADALALAQFAKKYGDEAREEKYRKKYEFLKKFINENLFEDGFFRAYHYYDDEDPTQATDKKGSSPRELIGYIPFMFDIPDEGREACFDHLLSPEGFFTQYGLTSYQVLPAGALLQSFPRRIYLLG